MPSSEKLERDMKVAALAGAGVPLSVIAREAGTSMQQAEYVISRKIPDNRNGLGDVYEAFREEVRPIIHSIILKALRKLDSRIDGAKVDIKDLISVFNALQAAGGIASSSGETETIQKVTTRVDLKKPEMVRALREALATERDKKQETEKALASGENG